MFKTMTIASVMLVQAVVEPMTADPDLTRYALTQGGLLIVVLVLLWSNRKESSRKDDRIEVLTTLVADTTAAVTKGTETTERLARAVESLVERRRQEREK
jgi:hypothetical protein